MDMFNLNGKTEFSITKGATVDAQVAYDIGRLAAYILTRYGVMYTSDGSQHELSGLSGVGFFGENIIDNAKHSPEPELVTDVIQKIVDEVMDAAKNPEIVEDDASNLLACRVFVRRIAISMECHYADFERGVRQEAIEYTRVKLGPRYGVS